MLQSAITFLRVLRIHRSDEDHDPASLRQRLFDQFARLTTRGFVVGADVAGAIAVRRVAVLREDQRLAGRAVDHLCLIFGINRADGYPVNAFRQQVVNDALLPGGREFGIDLEFDLDVGQFRLSLLGTFARDRPEIRSVVGDERDPCLFGLARLAGFARLAASLVLLHEAIARISNEIRMKITLRPGDVFMNLPSYVGLSF